MALQLLRVQERSGNGDAAGVIVLEGRFDNEAKGAEEEQAASEIEGVNRV